MKNKITIRDICLVSIFTAITAVMAQISIPMPMGVPMTMQTFAIALTGMMLGSKRGALAILIYILLGAAGVPVLAGMTGGINHFFEYTGGFLISFPLMAWIIGRGAEKGGKKWVILGMTIGTLINYACGMLVFMLAAKSGVPAAFFATVFPFIPVTVVKSVAAAYLGAKLRSRLAVAA